MSPKTAAAILRAHVAISFVAFGVLWAAGAIEGFGDPARLSLDVLKWPIDGDPGPLTPTTRFVSAIGGGILVGLGVLNLMLVAPGIEAGDRRVRKAALASIFSWFAIDSAGSIASGAASNAFFNVLVLALYAIPILLVRFPQDAQRGAT